MDNQDTNTPNVDVKAADSPASARQHDVLEIFQDKKVPSTAALYWREIKTDKFALVGAFVVVFILAFSFIGSAIITTDVATAQNLRNRLQPPSWQGGPEGYILGTDDGGRNMFQMLVVASRNSLFLGFSVAVISIIVGVGVGIFSGFYGGHVDNVIMRITDTWSMIPGFMFIIALVNLLPRTLPLFITLLVIFGWMGRARMIRAMALQQRNMDYVSASKTLGTRNIVIIFREVFPNMVTIIAADIVLTMSTVIGIETGLTLLGFGLRPGTPSLGTVINHATNLANLQNRWWMWFPGILMVFIISLCINFVGQAMQRAADPRQRLV